MSKPELTPWFVDGQAPAKPGIYNVSCRKVNQTGHWYAHWNGKSWSRADVEPDPSLISGRTSRATANDYWHGIGRGSWRGLASNPSEAA